MVKVEEDGGEAGTQQKWSQNSGEDDDREELAVPFITVLTEDKSVVIPDQPGDKSNKTDSHVHHDTFVRVDDFPLMLNCNYK